MGGREEWGSCGSCAPFSFMRPRARNARGRESWTTWTRREAPWRATSASDSLVRSPNPDGARCWAIRATGSAFFRRRGDLLPTTSLGPSLFRSSSRLVAADPRPSPAHCRTRATSKAERADGGDGRFLPSPPSLLAFPPVDGLPSPTASPPTPPALDLPSARCLPLRPSRPRTPPTTRV